MRRVTAIIRPFKLDEVRESLIEAGVTGLTVAEVKGFGRQRGHAYVGPTRDDEVLFAPKLMVEVVVDDGLSDQVLDIVRIAAFTGKIGDGKIFVQDVASTTRIRTGETGSDAL